MQWRWPRFRSWRFAIFYGLFVAVTVGAGEAGARRFANSSG